MKTNKTRFAAIAFDQEQSHEATIVNPPERMLEISEPKTARFNGTAFQTSC